MPIAPTTPVQPPTQTQFIITNVNVSQIEGAFVVNVIYAPTDINGNPIIAQQQVVTLGAPAMALLGTTKAKLYAALAAQVPALAGAVT